MNEQVKKLLDDNLSPEKVRTMSPGELRTKLISMNLVKTNEDFNMIVIEGLQRMAREDDEFPVHYYEKNEPMNEEHKAAGEGEEMLTDDYIASDLTPSA